MRGDERDAVDDRIDAALRRYAEAPEFSEPRVALARVRARAEQVPRRRRRVWMWAAAATAAAMIAVVVIWIGWRGTMRIPGAVQVAKSAPQGLNPNVMAARNGTPPLRGSAQGRLEAVPLQNGERHSMRGELRDGEERNAGPSTRDSNHCCAERHRAAIRTLAQDDRVVPERRLPKREVFPTPEPLSAEERALVAFATQGPPDVRKQVIEAQKHLGDPIEVAAIQMEPWDKSRAEPQTKGKDLP